MSIAAIAGDAPVRDAPVRDEQAARWSATLMPRLARSVLYAISQPDYADVGEIVIRPLNQSI